MTHLSDPETTAVPTSTSCDPRIVAVLDYAQQHVEHIDVVLADNEQLIAPLRAGTSWSRLRNDERCADAVPVSA